MCARPAGPRMPGRAMQQCWAMQHSRSPNRLVDLQLGWLAVGWAHLELVADHVPQALVVHDADVDVAGHLLRDGSWAAVGQRLGWVRARPTPRPPTVPTRQTSDCITPVTNSVQSLTLPVMPLIMVSCPYLQYPEASSCCPKYSAGLPVREHGGWGVCGGEG